MVRGTLKYCLLILLIAAGAVGKRDSAIDPALGIALFLKIVTYDESFDPKALKVLNICVVYDRKRVHSFEQFRQIEAFFKGRPDLKVNGVAVQYKAVTYDEIASTLKATTDSQYRLLLVTDIGVDRIGALSKKTQAHHVRSFSFDPAYVPFGLSVGIKVKKKGQLIVVNLESSRQEGSRFSAHLLKLCEIVVETELR